MMYVAAPDATLCVRAVQTVTLGEKILQRPGVGLEGFPHRVVGGLEPGGRRVLVGTRAPVSYFVPTGLAGHICVEVGQRESGAREANGYRVGSVEAKEPDAGFAFGSDIGADVELREARQPRDRWQKPGSRELHAKRRNAQPRRPVKGVELQYRRYQRAQQAPRHGPVHKEQVTPAHADNPWPLRERVGAVLSLVQGFLKLG